MDTKKIVLDASQRRAVELVCSARIGIVTGGPGTGKSTCLATALDQLDARGVRADDRGEPPWTAYELASPTGKAAKRLNETTGRPARTIHRLLAYHPNGGFRINAGNRLRTDVVVVDESSMVDIELGMALLSAIDTRRTRVIFIGDADQLPPVGPGRLFGDLVDARAVPSVRLQTLHRSARESWVAVNAPVMLRGVMPDLTKRKDFLFVETPTTTDILPEVRRLVTKVMPKIDADAQVLIPQRPGPAGIDAANRVLQATLNPRGKEDVFLPRTGFELRIADRVIHTRNDYELGVFNGEVGQIMDITTGGRVVVQLDGREAVTYTLEQAGALQLAYALTVHRAQGSEFAWVIVVCHSTHSYSLTRQLVYTAVTRAKQGVILVGDRKGLAHALSDARKVKRHTGLIERMVGHPDYSAPANDNGGDA